MNLETILRILRGLRGGPVYLLELSRSLGVDHSNLSRKYLPKLLAWRLVETEKSVITIKRKNPNVRDEEGETLKHVATIRLTERGKRLLELFEGG